MCALFRVTGGDCSTTTCHIARIHTAAAFAVVVAHRRKNTLLCPASHVYPPYLWAREYQRHGRRRLHAREPIRSECLSALQGSCLPPSACRAKRQTCRASTQFEATVANILALHNTSRLTVMSGTHAPSVFPSCASMPDVRDSYTRRMSHPNVRCKLVCLRNSSDCTIRHLPSLVLPSIF